MQRNTLERYIFIYRIQRKSYSSLFISIYRTIIHITCNILHIDNLIYIMYIIIYIIWKWGWTGVLFLQKHQWSKLAQEEGKFIDQLLQKTLRKLPKGNAINAMSCFKFWGSTGFLCIYNFPRTEQEIRVMTEQYVITL